MGSIVLGAVGSALGGPIGGLIGGQLGGVIDHMLFHKSVPKPSLQDLQVEASTMGIPIPKVYGRAKVAGNLIMSTILLPEKHHGKGGLSNSKGTSYYTYSVNCAVAICRGPINNIWRIYADTKVIWDMDPGFTQGSNSQPIPRSGFVSDQFGGYASFFQFGTGKNSNTQMDAGNAQFYLGTSNQGIDAECDIIAQSLGFAEGTVPAYRDLAYAVFMNFPLQDYGNRIPNFTFEVNGFYSGDQTIYSVPPLPGITTTSNAVYDAGGSVFWNIGPGSVEAFNAQTLSEFGAYDWGNDPQVTPVLAPNYTGTPFINNNSMIGPDGSLWLTAPFGTEFGPGAKWTGPAPGGEFFPNTHGAMVNIDPRDGVTFAFMLYPNWGFAPENDNPSMSIYCGSSNLWFVAGSLNLSFQIYDLSTGAPLFDYAGDLSPGHQYLRDMFQPATFALEEENPIFAASPILSERFDSVGFAQITSMCWAQNLNELVLLDGDNGWFYVLAPGLSGDLTQINPPGSLSLFPTGGGRWLVQYDSKTNQFLFLNNRYLVGCFSIDTTTEHPNIQPNQILDLLETFGAECPGGQFQIQQYPQGGYAIRVGNLIYTIDTSTFQVAQTNVLAQGWDWTIAGNLPSVSTPVFSPMGQGGILYQVTDIPGSPGATGIALYRPTDGGTITLGSIVSDICQECGLSPGQIDVSQLTETVYGYTISSEASGRVAIEQLEEIFLFDHVEIDGKLVGVHRIEQASNPVPPIDPADLGARAASPFPGDNAVPRVVETFRQDVEIPRAATLRYKTNAGDVKVKSFSMQIATQYARRAHQTTTAVGNVSLNTPLVLDDAQASQLIEKVLRLQYTQRVNLEWSLPVNYLYLTPGDVVPLTWTDPEGNVVSYSAYIQQADIGADNTIKLQGLSTNATAFVSNAVGQSPLYQTQPMVAGQPTTLAVMELPPLRDQDDDVGVYYGACGIGDSLNWSANIVTSIDGGQSFINVGTCGDPAIIGIAKSVLGGGATPCQWDLVNTLNVVFTAGTPESFDPVQVLNHSGIFLVGSEIIGAATAVENTDGSWTLSTLLRGIQGTDSAINGHLFNERVIGLVLDGTIQDQDYDLSQIGVSSVWAGITSMSDITASRRVNVTLTGNRIKPLPAARAGIKRDGSDNATLIWVPRRRIGIEWQDSIERGVDEAAEDYSVDIYDGSGTTVIRTLTAWSPILGTVGTTPSSDTGQRSVSYTSAQQIADGLVGGGAIWDPATALPGTVVFTQGGLTATTVPTGIPAQTIKSNLSVSSGLYYFEGTTFDAASPAGLGISDGTTDVIGAGDFATTECIAVNLNTRRFWSRISPTALWNGSASADPAAGVGGIDISGLGSNIFAAFRFVGTNESIAANFGSLVLFGAPPSGFSIGWPGPGAPLIKASIYQLSNRVGRGHPFTMQE